MPATQHTTGQASTAAPWRRGTSSPCLNAAALVIPSAVLELDAMLCRLSAARDRLALPLARAARSFHDARAWTQFGYSQASDWTHEHLGRSGSWLRRLATLHRAVEKHPGLATALTGADGGAPLGTAALLEIASAVAARCSNPAECSHAACNADLLHWIDRARRVSLRELCAELASATAGRPDAAASAAPGKHTQSGVAAAEVQVTLMAPPDIVQALEETLDLHRAVAGRETGLAEFVEALCAEGASGAFPFDVETKPLRPRAGNAAVPRPIVLHRFDGAHAGTGGGTGAVRRAAMALRRFADLERTQTTSPPVGHSRIRDLAARLTALVQLESTIEIRIGELLGELDRQRPWKLLRFTSAAHYAEERLHMNRTTARDRIDAARGLRHLPIVEQAYEAGRIGIEKALLVLRLSKLAPMDAGTQAAWVHRLEHATLKRCRDEYRALRRQHALDRSDPSGNRGGAVSPGSVRCATQPLMIQPLADTAWHASIRRTPGATRDLVLEIGCRVLDREHTGRLAPLGSKRLRLPEEAAHVFATSIDAARRAVVAAAAAPASPGQDARQRPSVRIARLFAGRPTGVPAWLGLLALLEEYVLVWDVSETMPDRRRHTVHERDGYRCNSPGCTQRQTLEAHHLRYRSHGGGESPANLITLCAFHHRLGEHGMLATCSGKAPLDVVWGLGTSDLRTWYRNELRLDERGPDAAGGRECA